MSPDEAPLMDESGAALRRWYVPAHVVVMAATKEEAEAILLANYQDEMDDGLDCDLARNGHGVGFYGEPEDGDAVPNGVTYKPQQEPPIDPEVLAHRRMWGCDPS